MSSATGQQNIRNLQHKIEQEWHPLNRHQRRWYDRHFYWSQWLIGGAAIVCVVAIVIRQLYYK